MFIIVLFLSQATAEVDVLNQPRSSAIEESQYQVEDGKKIIEDLDITSDNTYQDLCEEIKGRKLFRNASIGIPLGVVTALGAFPRMYVDCADGGCGEGSLGFNVFIAGIGTLVFSAVALPISVHILHGDAVKKGVDPEVSKGMLFLVDGVIFLGYVMLPVISGVAAFVVPIGYVLNGIQRRRILNSIRTEQKRVCGKTD